MPGTEVKIINQDADGVGEIICKRPVGDDRVLQ